jgi:hypothetical protein
MAGEDLVPDRWLENEDRVTRANRLERLKWIANLMPDANFLGFPGGLLSKYHFEEMRYCFVCGQFLAVVILGLAYIERTPAANFYAAGHDEMERANITTLLRRALESRWINEDEFGQINRARELRNALTHFRRPLHEQGIEYRAYIENDFPYTVIEDDARHVI